MRVIKFRGRGIDGGMYYGDLYRTKREVGIHVIGDGTFEVDPETVAQLVGFDKDGKEVYEGDTLIDSEGYEYLVSLQGMVLLQPLKKDGYVAHLPADLRTMLLDVAKRFTPLTLKED